MKKKWVMRGGEVVLFFSQNERQLWPCSVIPLAGGGQRQAVGSEGGG